MQEERLSFIDACEKAMSMVSQAREMDQLCQKAVRYLGEGGLRTGILEMAIHAMEDESLQREVFVNDESMLSFFCGVWIQFLLTEIAGVKKEKLRAYAQRVFAELQSDKLIH